MKDFLTIKNVLILIFALYLIVVIERVIQMPYSQSEVMLEYQAEKLKMQSEIKELTDKVHSYEKTIMQNSIDIINMSRAERDSTREVLNPR